MFRIPTLFSWVLEYSMENTRALSRKVVTLLSFTLATMFCSNAYAVSGANGKGVISEVTQHISRPLPVLAQASPGEAVDDNSQLIPQLAARTAQEALLRGEAVTLTSDFGQIKFCKPQQVNENLFTVTIIYSLFETDNPVEQESSIDPKSGSSQQSQILSSDLEVAGESSECQIPENAISPQLENGSNPGEADDDSADLVRTFILEGTLNEAANAAAFMGSAIATGLPLNYAEAGINIAITGVDYGLTTDLMSILPEILIPDHSDTEYIEVNVELLATAILLNNQIINNSSDATVSALAQNPYFLEINDNLRYFRTQF